VTETGTFCLGECFDEITKGISFQVDNFGEADSGITDTVNGFGMTENVIFCQDDKKD
jgi:hypothetical protein